MSVVTPVMTGVTPVMAVVNPVMASVDAVMVRLSPPSLPVDDEESSSAAVSVRLPRRPPVQFCSSSVPFQFSSTPVQFHSSSVPLLFSSAPVAETSSFQFISFVVL